MNKYFPSNDSDLLKQWNLITRFRHFATTSSQFAVVSSYFPTTISHNIIRSKLKDPSEVNEKRSSTRRMRTSNKSMMRLSILSTLARTFHPRLIWCSISHPHTYLSRSLEMQLRIFLASLQCSVLLFLIKQLIDLLANWGNLLPPPSLLIATLLLDEISLRATNIPSAHLTTLEWSAVLATRESQTRAIN